MGLSTPLESGQRPVQAMEPDCPVWAQKPWYRPAVVGVSFNLGHFEDG